MAWHFSTNFIPATDGAAVLALAGVLQTAGWKCLQSGTGTAGVYNATGYQQAVAADWDTNNSWALLVDPSSGVGIVIQRKNGTASGGHWSLIYSPTGTVISGSPNTTTPPTFTNSTTVLNAAQWFNTGDAFLAAAEDVPFITTISGTPIKRYGVSSVGYDGFSRSGHIFCLDPIDTTLVAPINYGWDTDPYIIWAEPSSDNGFSTGPSFNTYALFPSGLPNTHALATYKEPVGVLRSQTEPITGNDLSGRIFWEQKGLNTLWPKGYSTVLSWHYTTRIVQCTYTYSTVKDRMQLGDLDIPWNGADPVFPPASGTPSGPFNLELFPQVLQPSLPTMLSIPNSQWATAGEIVREAAQQLGLAGVTYSDGTALTDPYSSADQNIVRLRAMLETLGQRMLAERQWSTLRQSYVFNTIAGQGNYPLPQDYDRYIDQTGWNRTNRLPLGGPLSAQDRAVLKALLVNVTFTVLFDVIAGQFAAYPDNTVLPGGFVLAYEYQSKWWVAQVPVAYNRTTATTYTAQQVVTDGGGYFVALTGGTSAPQGGGLSALPHTAQADGTVTWMYVPAWAPGMPYVGADGLGGSPPVGPPFDYKGSIGSSDFVYANGQVFFCTKSGNSAANGGGPAGNGVGIPEGAPGAAGAALWTWFAPLTVAAQGAPATPNTNSPTASSDIVYFDEALMVEALKRKFRMENGWPWPDMMEKEYQHALTAAMTKDSVGKMLGMDKRAGGVPLIGGQNVPFSNFGL